MTSCKVTRFIVKVPYGYAPHGRRVQFTDKREASAYANRCTGASILTIPANFNR